MTGPALEPRPAARQRSWTRVVVGVGISVAAIVALLIGFVVLPGLGAHEPKFASLAEHPDRSLHGTVAYFADRSRCVRLVAAAGSPSKDLLCLSEMDVSAAQKMGKELGPQLVWLPDGRLEVTMFRMTDPPGPGYNPGWQKIVNVATGAVEDVPAGDVPASPNLDTHPMVNPAGDKISAMFGRSDGRVRIELTTASGVSRSLLSVHGPGEYTYGLISAFWAPNWQWIAADDGRILIITPGPPAVTRILTDQSRSIAFGGDDPQIARFAVTGTDLLPSP